MGLSKNLRLQTPRSAQSILAAALFVVSLVASNWIYSMHTTLRTYEGVGTAASANSNTKFSVDDLLSDSTGSYFAGGWPFKYYARVEHEGVPGFTAWSFSRAIINLLVWTCIASLLVGYLSLTRRKQNPDSEGTKPRRGQIGLLDIMIIMILLALSFGYWRLWTQRLADEKAIAKEIAGKGGSCELHVVVPSIVALVVPEIYLPIFSRITAVTLESPDDTMLQRVLSLSELRRLRIGGGSFDLKQLAQLRTLPYLAELRLAGRELDGSAVAALASCRQLVSLNLMRTNISTDGMRAMSDFPRLQKLSLVHTSVDVSQLQDLQWSKQLLELVVPHPGMFAAVDPRLGSEVCSRIQLNGWQKLQSLTCNEFDEVKNKNCVVLEIADCPALTEVRLDLLQRFDLVLDNLPELQKVSGIDSQWNTRIRNDERVSFEPWVRRVSTHQTPKLSKLDFFAEDLDQLQLDPATPIQLGITSEYRSPINKSKQFVAGDGRLGGSYRERGLTYMDDIPMERSQRWIDELGKIACPAKVDLSWLELQDVDLSPLQSSSGIRELDLSWTNITGAQLLKLEGMPSLEKLILNGSEMDAIGICRAISKLKALRELRFQSPNVRGLNLQSLPNLETIFVEPEPRIFTSLRLVSMPRLRESFEVQGALTRCELVDIPSVQGLAFSSPLPKKSTIRGLRDLRFFSAGGPGLSDEIVQQVLHCPQLRCLSLAYATQVSANTLTKLVELPELEYLALPGCNLTAETMKILGGCKKLASLNLDDNAVGDEAFEDWNLASIREFSVNHTLVTENLINKVLSNPSISKLGLAGVKLSTTTIERIAKSKLLSELDLSDSELDANSWKALKEHLPGRNLKLLLRDAKVQLKSVDELIAANPDLIVDLTGCTDPSLDDSTSVLAQLIWKANSMSGYDRPQRVIDTWQLGDEFEQRRLFAMQMSFAQPKAVPSRFAPYVHEGITAKGRLKPFDGEIKLFQFSPKWKESSPKSRLR